MNCLSKLAAPVAATVQPQINTLCRSMYQANLRMEAQNYPSKDQDLFMENIAFCGLNGYRPFSERLRWLEMIISWQRQPGGCFTVNLHQLARLLSKGRSKRRERILADGCSLHKTSMAQAAIFVYIKRLSAAYTGDCSRGSTIAPSVALRSPIYWEYTLASHWITFGIHTSVTCYRFPLR